MSADAPAAQASWKADNGFKYPLLCDTDHKARPAGRSEAGCRGTVLCTTLRCADRGAQTPKTLNPKTLNPEP